MATFTPPTHTEYMAPPGADRLWSRVPYQRGNAVLVNDGVASTYPGLQVVDSDALQAADYAYLGSVTYTDIPPDAEIALISAGYEFYLSEETWPAWL